MRHIKYAVASVLLIIAFVATSERFVYHLAHFEETFWRISFEYSLYGKNGADEIVKQNLQSSIQDYAFDVYYIDTQYLSDFQETRIIYGTEGALTDLYRRGIHPKTYRSLFTGEIEIVFQPFSDIEDIFNCTSFFVVGPIANAAAFKNATDESHFYSVDDISDLSGSEDGIYATLLLVWGIVFLLLLLLTLYQGLLAKKELVVKLTLGESPYYTVTKSTLSDIVAYIGLFFGIYAIFSHFFPVQYKFPFIAGLFFLMLLVNTGLHFLQAQVSLKRNLSGSMENKHTLTASYIVKSVSILLACFVLSSNAVIISEAINYFRQAEIWEHLSGYGFYRMTYPSKVARKLGNEITDDEMLWSHFHEQFGKDAIWMVDMSGSYEYNALLLNNQAVTLMMPYVSGDLKKQFSDLEQDKLYLFFPSALRDDELIAQAITMTSAVFLGGPHGAENTAGAKEDGIRIQTYAGYSKVLGINRDTHLYGSKFLDNPIIIVDTRGYMASQIYQNVMYPAKEVLYRLEDSTFQSFVDAETLDGCIIKKTNAVDLYQYNLSSITKNFRLMLAVSFFILFLEVMMLVFLVRLEYTINGMEMAVKKTLGYSCFERTKKIAALTAASIVLCTVLAMGVSFIFHLGDSLSVLLCSIPLFLTELVLVAGEAVHMDRVLVCSILKGAQI